MKNNDEEVETLDFLSDEEVSNQIDEMLDFIDLSDIPNNSNDNKQLQELLTSSDKTENKVEIDASREKLDEYKQSEMNLLDWDAKKRRQAISISKNLECLKLKAKKKEEGLDKYSLDEFLKDIDEINSELDVIYKKYDYSKLPK